MKLNKNDDIMAKGEKDMKANIVSVERPCTVRESIIQSCKEVKMMREGKTPIPSLDDLFDNISKWKDEAKKGD